MSDAGLRDPDVLRFLDIAAHRILGRSHQGALFLEDLRQEGLLTFWQTEGNSIAYRLGAARYRMIDCARSWLGRDGSHRNRTQVESLDAARDVGGDYPVNWGDTLQATDDVEAAVEFRELVGHIHTLPERHRDALVCYLRDELQEDVAERWGCTPGRMSQIRKEATDRVLAATG